MQQWTCKCGKSFAFGSDPPSLCSTCSECGSTLLRKSDGEYCLPEEHEFITRYNQNTGKPYEICRYCWQRKE